MMHDEWKDMLFDPGSHYISAVLEQYCLGSFLTAFVAVQTYHHHIRCVDIDVDVLVSQKWAHALQMIRIDGIVHRHSLHVSPYSSSCLSPKVVNQSISIQHHFQNLVTIIL